MIKAPGRLWRELIRAKQTMAQAKHKTHWLASDPRRIRRPIYGGAHEANVFWSRSRQEQPLRFDFSPSTGIGPRIARYGTWVRAGGCIRSACNCLRTILAGRRYGQRLPDWQLFAQANRSIGITSQNGFILLDTKAIQYHAWRLAGIRPAIGPGIMSELHVTLS